MFGGVFWRQFVALFRKNWIVLWAHPIANVLRCFILPIAFGVFLATAQQFLNTPDNFGIGQPIPVYALETKVDSLLLWVDATDGTSSPSPSQIMSWMTASFTPSQQQQYVKQLFNASDIHSYCPENFIGLSQCFGAVIFYDIPANSSASRPVNYTIQADAGLGHIDVQRHTSDYEQKVLPLQWAIDNAIIELQTGVQLQTPLEWPFTQETNADQSTSIRLGFIGGINSLLVLALFVCYIGIAYQLPGAIAGERANGLTAHMKAMGLRDSARILSWHVTISLVYLPAWIVVGLTWHYRIFSSSNVGLILVVHLLLGLTLASWSFFVAAPFGKSPQLAAVVTTFLCILFAILALVLQHAKNGTVFIFTLLFPPAFYVFAIRAIGGWELQQMPTNVVKADPTNHLILLYPLIAAIIDVFLWPCMAVLLEHYLYDVKRPSSHRRFLFWKRAAADQSISIPPDVAISVRNLHKTFKKSTFLFSKSSFTAIDDLSFDVPKGGIFVLLGSNGAGKSTTLSIIGGLISRSSGDVTFEGGQRRPPRGTIGLVPQKNILFPDLSCIQNLRVWQAVKWSANTDKREDLMEVLRSCDLEEKARSNAGTLSGGQKRKLQLAAGLVGGSEIVLVDECTSGVDPLSRRSLWRTLVAVRGSRTVVFTTHFLDEADLLADQIVILDAPGKVVAQGTPVALKRELGKGYSLQVTFDAAIDAEKADLARSELLQRIRALTPDAQANYLSALQTLYRLNTRDVAVVARLLQLLGEEKSKFGIASYDVLGTSIEDVFLGLMEKSETTALAENDKRSSNGTLDLPSGSITKDAGKGQSPVMRLTRGVPTSLFQQAFTIFYKRLLILRRSWLSPFLTVSVAVAAATIPTTFIVRDYQTCANLLHNFSPDSLYLPSAISSALVLAPHVVESPPGIVSTLGTSMARVPVTDVPDNATFVNTISNNYRDLTLGGISVNPTTGESLIAWEASPPGLLGPVMLNLVTNILYNQAINASSGQINNTSRVIRATFRPLPAPSGRSLNDLKWAAFFGIAMSVYPAFFALYVSRERRSSVQAMQSSNGLTNPLGLWLGHLMFDTIWTIILSTIIIIVFSTVSRGFQGLGFFWLVLVLYGITAALFAYCATLVVSSPLAAFAIVAGYQIIMFLLYFAGYLLVLTFAKTASASSMISIIHWTLSLASPVASAMRAGLVSINLFSLLCDGTTVVNASSLGQIQRFGGPILYLILYSCVLLAILYWRASGSLLPRRSNRPDKELALSDDVAAEANATDDSNDILRVVHVSKRYKDKQAVDNVSFGVPQGSIFTLLGPNGAGKTTTFNMIRGDTFPDSGNIFVAGTSAVRNPRVTRLSLGVCPQFTAIDAQLTVREHLIIYGRLKGIPRHELDANVTAVMHATALHSYADRFANKLSGGNQRKLALAIALIGNPPVLLIDEFSSGIDAKMKRDMWNTLRHAAFGKAVILTTHSMEEASALADRVGILARRLLAIGSVQSLSDQHATYEVHFNCRTREDQVKIQKLMAQIPGSRMADDVATRFEVPIGLDVSTSGGGLSLSRLFDILTTNSDDNTEFTVAKATLESVFLRVIRENNAREEDGGVGNKWWRFCA
ncbi:hypothetical protein JOM56_005071 [Amanita muscaria]